MPRKLAVFDIDGTIIRSSLIVELVNGLIESGIFPKEIEKEIEEDYSAWINRRGDYVSYIRKVVHAYRKHLAGKREKEIKEVIKNVIESEKDKVYVFAREFIKKLKKENYFLLAISGSPDYIVEEFSKTLGFDSFYGSRQEVKEGIFTGKELIDVSLSKSDVLLGFLKENDFKLEETIGVGDSEIDIPFLDLIGAPIAFNPNRKLAEHARKKKWKIVVERKDVVYDLRDFDFEKITS